MQPTPSPAEPSALTTPSPADSPTKSPLSAEDRTTWAERLGFASGTLPFNFGASGINTLAYPIYNMTMGVSPTLIGLGLAIARLWDGFTDPVVGTYSDNSRSRWGRRRPFLAVGAVLCALTFPLIWLVPQSWSGAWAFGYFLFTTLLFYTAFTVYAVPYLTLGYEMSADSSERVRIHSVRAMVSKLTFFIIPWIFAIAQLPVFGSTIAGMRTLGFVIGGLFILLALPTVLLTRERFAKQASRQQKIALLPGLRMTAGNRPFLYLVGIVLGMLVANNLSTYLGIYVNTYHVWGGDTLQGAALQAKSQTVYALAGLAAVPVVARLATRYGKLRIIRWCMACGIAASVSKFFCFHPEYPWLQYISMLLLSPSFSGFWVLVDPMKADTVDHDELSTGLRREGTYAAVAGWLEKMTLTGAMLVSGLLLDLSGFSASRAAEQDPLSLFIIRLMFSVLPAVALLGSLALAIRYPLSDERVRAMKDELAARRAPVG